MVSVCQESRRDLAGWFWVSVSHDVSTQSLEGFRGSASRMVSWQAVHTGPQFLSGYWQEFSVSHCTGCS